MDDRDDDARDAPTRRRSNQRPTDDDTGDEPGTNDAEATASKTVTRLRPLPPVPARFDRSQRGPTQTQGQQPTPPRRPNGSPPTATPPAATPPAATPPAASPPGAPDGSPPKAGSPWAAEAPNSKAGAELAEASAEEIHDERVRKIDESLTRMTAAHAGLSKSVGAKTAKRTTAEADAEPDPDEPDASPKTRRRLVRAGKLLAVATAAALFIVAAAGWGTKLWLDTQIREVAALDLTSDSIINAAGQEGDENFLLVGSDNRPGVPRSDSIMVAHLPADRSRAVLISFPRDLEIDRPDCQRWDPTAMKYTAGNLPEEQRSKLTAAYETGGPRCLTKVIQKATGLSITRFIGIDFKGFKEMVDAAQGVEICVEKPVIDGVLGVVVPNAGTTTINGARALDLVRARNVRGDPTADYGQIQRQQQFLSALLRTAASNHVALDPTAVRHFVSAFAAYSVADRAGADELLTLAQSMQRLDPAAVSFRTVPTTGQPNNRGNEVLRDSDAKALFTALREDKTLPDTKAAGETAASGPDTSGDAPAASDVRLQVLNASERTGLASQVGSSLEKLDFTVVSVGNADTRAERTVIRYSADRAKQAKVLAAVVPDAAMQADESETGALQLVLGADFDGIVSPLAGSSSGLAGSATPAPQPTATCR